MYFRRKIYGRLLEWKETSKGKSAVLIEGARRVGKSTIAEEFARKEYDDYILLDFALESKDMRQNFEDNIGDLDTFFRNLFIIKGKDLPRRRAVIIFDEVQLFPLARQAIKYLVADGRYDYIETGSLISIKKNVQNILIPSEEEKLKMYPMDFEEFLWAKGNTAVMPAIKAAFESRKPLGNAAHRKIMQIFREYIAVGGMPQAVLAYVNGESYASIDRVKQGILSLYEDDLRKYDDEEREKASLVFKTIPKQLSDHEMHFTFSEINTNARYVKLDDFNNDKIDFVSADLSFISLKHVLNVIYNILSDDGISVVLIKPQFEAGKEEVEKGGVVKDERIHKKVINDIIDYSKNTGFMINGLTFSPIKGPSGNIEYLLYLSKNNQNKIFEFDINDIVNKSHEEAK